MPVKLLRYLGAAFLAAIITAIVILLTAVAVRLGVSWAFSQ